ncbi:MAG: methyltransferase domain-containing protein, partial [Leptolyngbya sp.]|nr:methyltransferase domain-containing protein [Candidatus Melainabacteria bacterium]
MLVLPEVKLPKDAVRLCLGAGETPFDDYQNFDFFSVHENVTQCDLRRLPFEDNSVDEIFALQPEHIPHPEILTTFTEWLRVLKPNGYFSMNFPDFVWVMKNWLELPEEERWGYKFGVIFGMQNTPCDVHYTGFTKERAIELLTTAGFSEVRAEFRDQFDHQRVWAFARKPMQPNTSSTNENLAGSVLPAAMLSTKLFYDSK